MPNTKATKIAHEGTCSKAASRTNGTWGKGSASQSSMAASPHCSIQPCKRAQATDCMSSGACAAIQGAKPTSSARTRATAARAVARVAIRVNARQRVRAAAQNAIRKGPTAIVNDQVASTLIAARVA